MERHNWIYPSRLAKTRIYDNCICIDDLVNPSVLHGVVQETAESESDCELRYDDWNKRAEGRQLAGKSILLQEDATVVKTALLSFLSVIQLSM